MTTSTENTTKKIVHAALFAALSFVLTYFIKIPLPTGGYIHPGDGMVLLSGLFLGPVYGSIAAGIGSALADLLGGYVIYAPATFLAKAAAAATCSLLCRRFYVIFGTAGSQSRQASLQTMETGARIPSKADTFRNMLRHKCPGTILACIAAEALMVSVYFVFECFLYNPAAALLAVPFNCIQSAFGILVATTLFASMNAKTRDLLTH